MKTDMKEIQNKILEIAIYFDEFCKKNKIKYYMMGGSALGAIRHNGFIPWDDDYDVFMTYDNYIKFKDACKKNLDTNRFYFQEEDTSEWPSFFSKIRMNDTTFIEEDTRGLEMHKGFYIDVMCLNNAYSNKFLRYLQYLSAKILNAHMLYDRGYTTDSKLKKIAMKVTNICVTEKVKRLLLSYVRSLNHKTTEYVGHFFGRAKFSNTTFPKEYLGDPRYVHFSSTFLPVPHKAEKYLEIRYGKNYMDMPDEKTKAKYPSHAVFVDPNKDYIEYEDVDINIEI